MEKKYKIDIIKYSELEDKVVLPKFQRPLVWSKSQKEELIETLRSGFPFGSILISVPNTLDIGSNSKYTLIDGLQRYSTIKDYANEPYKYFKDEDIEKSTIDLLKKITRNISGQGYENKISQCSQQILGEILIKKHNTKGVQLEPDALEKIIYEKLDMAIDDDVASNGDFYREIIKLQHDIIEKYVDFLNVDDLEIPCIIFKGDNSELADVFYNLNRGGVKLSKYQILAATWDNQQIILEVNDICNTILEHVLDRYDGLIESREITIENYDRNEFEEKRTINLFEFCYALGKEIISECGIFYKNHSDDRINELGFASLAVVFNKRNKDIGNIVDEIETLKKPGNIEFIVKNVVKLYKKINSEFSDKSTVLEKQNLVIEISSFQLISMFASMWSNKIEKDINGNFSVRNGSSSHERIILSNITKSYFLDYINNFWKGSGDGKLDDVYYKSMGVNPTNRYLQHIDEKDFKDKMLEYFKARSDESSLKFSSFNKTIICIAYSNVNYKSNTTYEFEHIISKKILSDKEFADKNLPGGIIGNICLLDRRLNNSKKDNFIYSYANSLDLSENEGFLKEIDYISNIDSNNILANTGDKRCDEIRKFIRYRNETVINKLCKRIF